MTSDAPVNVYLLDTNIFIEAKQRYYAFDVCPGFWQALVWHHGQGVVVSIDRVKHELDRIGDELSAWASNELPNGCFKPTDLEAVLSAYSQAVNWVNGNQTFLPEAKAEFSSVDNADAWVIAFAKATGATVVTHEKSDPNVRRRVPIPNVCDALQVGYINTFDMIRALGMRFSWADPA